MRAGSFLEVNYGRGVLLTTQPLLVPWSWKSRAIPLPTLWATTGPVTGHFTFSPFFRFTNRRNKAHVPCFRDNVCLRLHVTSTSPLFYDSIFLFPSFLFFSFVFFSFLLSNQQMQLFAVNFIPLPGSLYIFWAFYTPIIRSTISTE